MGVFFFSYFFLFHFFFSFFIYSFIVTMGGVGLGLFLNCIWLKKCIGRIMCVCIQGRRRDGRR